MIDRTELWIVILCLGLGSFLLRFAFTGFVGGRELPPWVVRHLRYTAVAVLPALVAPQVIWPSATGGTTDPARLAAACAAFVVGLWTKNVLAAIASGAITLYTLLWLLG